MCTVHAYSSIRHVSNVIIMPYYFLTGRNGDFVFILTGLSIIAELISSVTVSIALILSLEPVVCISDNISALLGICYSAYILVCVIRSVRVSIEVVVVTGKITVYPTVDPFLTEIALCVLKVNVRRVSARASSYFYVTVTCRTGSFEVNLLFYIDIVIITGKLMNVSAIGAYAGYNNSVIARFCTFKKLACISVVMSFFSSLVCELYCNLAVLNDNRVIVFVSTCIVISYYVMLGVKDSTTGLSTIKIYIISNAIVTSFFIITIIRESIVIKISFLTTRTRVKLYVTIAVVVAYSLNN